MHFDILTLFPAMFAGPFAESIIQRAQEAHIISITLHNIRDYATGKHRITDDYPYGGGGGMVMKPEPLFATVEAILGPEPRTAAVPIVLLTPQGRSFNQDVAQDFAGRERVLLICGRYEGVDERVRQYLATDELSIGDFVLSGGELAAMVVVDAVTRLLPGALGDPTGALDDSHAMGLLEYPHYTRPPEFRGWPVPEVLLSGNHGEVARWRRQEALRRTLARRPDLLPRAPLTAKDRELLRSWGYRKPGGEPDILTKE
jgi:tRNA (guanine37-N1)-methyltransferase